MTVAIYKLNKDGERMKSYRVNGYVTKIEDDGDGNILIHDYYTDKGLDKVEKLDPKKYEIEVFF